MFNHLFSGPLYKCAESVVDNLFRDKVAEPAIGSVVYCSLAMGYVDHSGIYIGRNRIVHLDGSGLVEIVSPEAFLLRLDGLNLAISITVSAASGSPVGGKAVAARARRRVGEVLQYSLLTNNCHTFSASCVTGRGGARPVTMQGLKRVAAEHLGASEWRVWDQERTPKRASATRKPSKAAASSVIAPTEWPFPTSSRP